MQVWDANSVWPTWDPNLIVTVQKDVFDPWVSGVTLASCLDQWGVWHAARAALRLRCPGLGAAALFKHVHMWCGATGWGSAEPQPSPLQRVPVSLIPGGVLLLAAPGAATNRSASRRFVTQARLKGLEVWHLPSRQKLMAFPVCPWPSEHPSWWRSHFEVQPEKTTSEPRHFLQPSRINHMEQPAVAPAFKTKHLKHMDMLSVISLEDQKWRQQSLSCSLFCTWKRLANDPLNEWLPLCDNLWIICVFLVFLLIFWLAEVEVLS